MELEKVCLGLCQRLDVNDWRELPETLADLLRSNAAMNELEGQIMVALSVVSPEAILAKIADLSDHSSKQSELLQSIATTVKTSDVNRILQRVRNLAQLRNDVKEAMSLVQGSSLVEGITGIMDEAKQASDFIEAIEGALRVSDRNQIIPLITQIMQDRDTILLLNRKFPSRYVHETFEENFEQLLAEFHRAMRLGQLLDCEGLDNIEKGIQKLNSDLSNASILFSKVLSIVSASDITISFPIDEASETRLTKVIDDAKVQFENDRTQVELLLNRAHSFGYRGNDLGEAIDTIVAACGEADKDKSHSDLMVVRASHEKQKMKLQKSIDDLTEQVLEQKERCTQLENAWKKEQQIRHEIVLMASGQLYDKEVVRQALTATEFQSLEQRWRRKSVERSASQ
jgi:hypothetical protein